jgi:hypothetical protein
MMTASTLPIVSRQHATDNVNLDALKMDLSSVI